MRKYLPKPLNTADVKLPPGIHKLLEKLAEHNHNVWADQRFQEGWTWGPHRDDAARKHPGLVSYRKLSESEKDYDRNTALEILKAIIALGYSIKKTK